MAVHDRLKPPTLEAAPTRAFFGLPVTLALAVMAAGFAYAMPRLQTVSAESDDSMVVVEASPTDPSHTLTATPSPDPTDDSDADDNDADDNDADNHGKAVSTAAHCDIKGKAHGELVRSIAADKDATVADAEAACAAALAAQVAAVDEAKANEGRGHSAKVTGPAKSVPPVKAPKAPANTTSDDDTSGDDSTKDDDSDDDDSEDDSDDDASQGVGTRDG